MKKILITILSYLILSVPSFAQEGWKLLQEGGKIVWIRHSITTPSCCGDPENLKINDRSTQRNLGKEGIAQSKKIGQLLDTKVGAANKSNIKEWLDSKVR